MNKQAYTEILEVLEKNKEFKSRIRKTWKQRRLNDENITR